MITDREAALVRRWRAENEWKVYFDIGDAEAYGSIAPLAICRAALLAVMEAE